MLQMHTKRDHQTLNIKTLSKWTENHKNSNLICRARVPKILARSYFVMYLDVLRGRSTASCSCFSSPSASTSGISSLLLVSSSSSAPSCKITPRKQKIISQNWTDTPWRSCHWRQSGSNQRKTKIKLTSGSGSTGSSSYLLKKNKGLCYLKASQNPNRRFPFFQNVKENLKMRKKSFKLYEPSVHVVVLVRHGGGASPFSLLASLPPFYSSLLASLPLLPFTEARAPFSSTLRPKSNLNGPELAH